MSVLGFLEPAVGRLAVSSNGLGLGISVEGAVLEGRMSVQQALAMGGNPLPVSKPREWDQVEIDAVWAERDSVFG